MSLDAATPSGAIAIDAGVPTRATGVEPIGEMSHSGFREPPCLVRRADGQMLQLTPLAYAVLCAVDGRRDLAAIADEVESATGRCLEAEDVGFLIDEKLRPLGVLRNVDGTEPDVEKANPLLALRWRVVVSKPEVTRAITRPFVWLFRPPVVVAALAAFVVAVGWVLLDRGLGTGLRSMLFDPKQLLLVFGLAALSAGFHEFGHAAACRYGGGTPGAMGAGIYIVWPAFYTDVTDSYRLDRRGRLRTDLGGLYFNCLFTVGTVVVGALTGAEALFVLVPLQILQMVHQLLPILRLDGYHILADLTGVPDLYNRIRPTLRSAIPGAAQDERATALKPTARRVVTAWVVVVIPLLVLSLGSAALALPRVLATAAASVALHWAALQRAWAAGNVYLVLAGLLAVASVILPVAGTLLIVQRIATRVARSLWHRFDAPVGRALLVVLGGLAAIALLAAWWPRGQYEPIARTERWRVQELPMTQAVAHRRITPVVDAVGPRPVVAPGRADTAIDDPEGRTDDEADGAVAAPAVGTADETATRGGGTVSRSVEGDDNLALAVNDADGASVFSLAFSVRSVADDVAGQTNRALALASCTDCTTVALAFQVVLLFGDTDTVVPENQAEAYNVSCVACVTFAAATQIILGFDGPVELTDAGIERLADLHRRLLSLADRVADMTAAQLAALVEDTREELIEILSEELVPVPPDEVIGEVDDAGDADATDASTTTTTEADGGETDETDETESDGSTDGAEEEGGDGDDGSSSTSSTTSTSTPPSTTSTTLAEDDAVTTTTEAA